jgi:hypothetical protein
MKTIINTQTGEIVERELNQEELLQDEIDTELGARRFIEETEKNRLRLQILERLGLTEDEAKVLLG